MTFLEALKRLQEDKAIRIRKSIKTFRVVDDYYDFGIEDILDDDWITVEEKILIKNGEK